MRSWHLVLPGALTVAFAFRAGGFFPAAVAVAAVLLVIVLVARITLVERPFAGWSVGIAVSAGALACLAAWTLASAAWSDAPGRALLEFDRALLYALLVVVMGAVAARPGDLELVLRWTFGAILVVAVAGLLSRVLPDAFPVSANIVDDRLSFPLTYWNAMGMLTGVGVVLAVHLAAVPGTPLPLRLAAAAALPALATTLYFTFARGPIAVTVAALVVYAAVGRVRGLAAVLLAAGLPTAVALQQAIAADLLARPEYADAAGAAEGRTVALVVAGCALAAAGLRAATLPLDRRLAEVRLPARARRPVLAGGAVAALLALAVVAFAVDAPSRIEDARAEFSRGTILPATGDLRDRFTELGNNGRIAGWRVARDAFASSPWQGTGAGTFRLSWERRREADFQVTDAHSLYLEVLSELGVPGLVLLLAGLLSLPVAAALRARGEARPAHAAYLAASVALLLHAGADWDWEMPAVFVWFLGAGAVAAAARPAAAGPALGRLPRVVAGLACLLLAVAPALVLTSQQALDRSVSAFARGDCGRAIDQALASVDALSVRAEPYEVLGYCDARAGQGPLAVRAMAAARDRDPGNWAYAYGLAIAQAIAGEDPRAAAAEARRLNPLEPLAADLDRRLRATDSRARWRRIAARARIPFR